MTSRKATLGAKVPPQPLLEQTPAAAPVYSIRYHKTSAAKLLHRGRGAEELATIRRCEPCGCTMGACLGEKEKPEVHRSLRTQHKSAKQT